MQAGATPTANFEAPVEGANVAGYIGGTDCEVSASGDTTAVDFYLDGQYVNHQDAAPWNCYFNADGLGNGWHTLAAVARDSQWRTSQASVRISTAYPGHADGGSEAATIRPAGSEPLSDGEAAAKVKRSSFEPRPGNAKYNQTVPTDAQLANFNGAPENAWAQGKVTGRFTGTTDEILQWAAHKWGLDEDVVRAVAAAESWWDQTAGGAQLQGGGLMSPTWSQAPGLLPIGMDSTAMNVDYFAGSMRWYYDGNATWLNDVERGQQYTAGDLWGSIGAWSAGRWRTAGSNEYAAQIKDYWAQRVWEGRGF